ncbi:hypothetical protein LINPERHAP1_LOCUS3841 [Linum perenne]
MKSFYTIILGRKFPTRLSISTLLGKSISTSLNLGTSKVLPPCSLMSGISSATRIRSTQQVLEQTEQQQLGFGKQLVETKPYISPTLKESGCVKLSSSTLAVLLMATKPTGSCTNIALTTTTTTLPLTFRKTGGLSVACSRRKTKLGDTFRSK